MHNLYHDLEEIMWNIHGAIKYEFSTTTEVIGALITADSDFRA